MITDKPRPVASFVYVDYFAEGVCRTTPADGETFLGIPYAYYTDNSAPFIEVHRNGEVVRTINALVLESIEFAAAEPQPTAEKTT